nr:hypothetical protein CFP56_16281 [Quercus suber]
MNARENEFHPHLHQTSITKTENKKFLLRKFHHAGFFFSFSVDDPVKGLLASFVTWISQMPQLILEPEIPKLLAGILMSMEFGVSISIEFLVAVTAFVIAGCRSTPKALFVLPSSQSSDLGGHSETIEINKIMGIEISLDHVIIMI